MRFKKYALLFAIIFCVILSVSCSKTSDPKTDFNKFIVSWQKQEFKNMYSLLNSASKQKLKENEFIQNFKNVYEPMKVSGVRIKYKYPDNLKVNKNTAKIFIPVEVKLTTMAGDIKYSSNITIVKEKIGKNYDFKIAWNDSMLYPKLENGDKITVKKTAAKRGEITDRNGIGLAINGSCYSVGVVPQTFNSDKANSEKLLSEALNISQDQIEKKLNASWVKPNQFVPIANVPKSKRDTVLKLIALPGVRSQETACRVYPYNEAEGHLIGYIGAVTKDDLNKLKDQDYSQNDMIGKAGLEQIFEKRLRGTSGIDIYIVDSKGNKKQDLITKAAADGENIKLTIDINIQKAMYNEIQNDPGVGVSINPKTGEVLALLSTPTYDPNGFITGFTSDAWNSLNSNQSKPFINRFSQTFAPGSTFKVVTAAIGLKEGTLDPDKTKNITGMSWQKDSSWGSYKVTRVDDPGKSENLQDAFVYSDNIFFAQTALDIGADKYTSGTKTLGIGENLPFEYPLKKSQLSNSGTINGEIQLADSGYGQAQVMMNPLHLALIYGAVANGGDMLKPLLETKDAAAGAEIWHKGVISSDISGLLVKDLIQVVENPNGTGHAAKLANVTIAGKTGTAEIKASQSDNKGTENGWFVAFNTDNPRLLVLMMTENAKNNGGSHYVVPKVGNVLSQFLK
ncbi:MAG: hypothetical protein K8E24_013355 [Methanobacterium paludis]|nr:hypothetical protein [Methanobacterium paludis]